MFSPGAAMRLSSVLCCLVSAVAISACSSGSQKTAGDSPQRSGAQISSSGEYGFPLQPAARRGGTAPDPEAAVSRGGSTSAIHSGRGDYGGYPALARLIDRLEREEGFDTDHLERVFSRVERQQWILDFVNRPKAKRSSGPTGAWNRYRAKFLTDSNISNGVGFWRRYEAVLNRAHAKYGVPPEYVVAILGVETRYGGYMGKHRVIDALATLAFDYPRRSEFFTGELEAFLIMARDEKMDPFQPRGSYAGAMGMGQFMPSSFHNWAVDFDGDGRRDLWNPVDAIGSVANYFASHGWRSGESVAVRARVSGSAARAMKTGYDTSYSLSSLSRDGIAPVASLSGSGKVSLLELDAAGGYEYWLGLPNFYVITRYNHSTYYAMAVHQLAQAVRSRHGPSADAVLTLREDSEEGPAL
jgi:membrane-bound lytic murein transglycosylase B